MRTTFDNPTTVADQDSVPLLTHDAVDAEVQVLAIELEELREQSLQPIVRLRHPGSSPNPTDPSMPRTCHGRLIRIQV